MSLRCLSLWEPWAACIALGWKPIENRPVRYSHRGPLAIASAKRWYSTEDVEDALRRKLRTEPLTTKAGYETRLEELRVELHRAMCPGHVVAVVHLGAIISEPSVPSPREQAWCVPGSKWLRLSEHQRLLRPVPVRGMQGMFSLPPEVEAAVRAQVAL